MNITHLNSTQKKNRRLILKISYEAEFSHLGSCLSAVDLIDAIYEVKRKDEVFVLSNGHAGIALYVILFKNKLIKYSQIKSLGIHPDRNKKLHIYVSTGSLGQGLPIALGMALADRKQPVYCMISDGECSEGSIWETLRIITEQKVLNLRVILNANGWGAYKAVSLPLLKKRFQGFGYDVVAFDGHHPNAIKKALRTKPHDKPIMLFANTTVDQLQFLKGQDAHYHTMTKDEYQLAEKKFGK